MMIINAKHVLMFCSEKNQLGFGLSQVSNGCWRKTVICCSLDQLMYLLLIHGYEKAGSKICMVKGTYSCLGDVFEPDIGGRNPCLVQIDNKWQGEKRTHWRAKSMWLSDSYVILSFNLCKSQSGNLWRLLILKLRLWMVQCGLWIWSKWKKPRKAWWR